jgi:uncharacterized membrane protein
VDDGYNRLAGRSLERLAALSDGVFAIAMTLLVLDLRVPAAGAIHDDAGLRHALLDLAPRLVVYVMSFMTLGIFWLGQQTQLSHLARSDRDLNWLHFAFLFFVTLMPFSTSLIAEFVAYRLALVLYWANILLLGAALFASWRYARHASLTRDEATVELACAVERRILVAQSLYAIGALLCIVSPYWSIGFILLVQLNYVLAPRIPILWRL